MLAGFFKARVVARRAGGHMESVSSCVRVRTTEFNFVNPPVSLVARLRLSSLTSSPFLLPFLTATCHRRVHHSAGRQGQLSAHGGE